MKNIFPVLAFCALAFLSCEKVKDTASNTIDTGAQTVGKTASDIVNSLDKGITESTAVNIELSEPLKKKGLSYGKYYIRENEEGKENTISLYLITENDLSQNLHLKLFDKNGVEMGRVEQKISQKKGQAAYFDFVFDDKIEMENQSKLTIE